LASRVHLLELLAGSVIEVVTTADDLGAIPLGRLPPDHRAVEEADAVALGTVFPVDHQGVQGDTHAGRDEEHPTCGGSGPRYRRAGLGPGRLRRQHEADRATQALPL